MLSRLLVTGATKLGELVTVGTRVGNGVVGLGVSRGVSLGAELAVGWVEEKLVKGLAWVLPRSCTHRGQTGSGRYGDRSSPSRHQALPEH